MPFKDLAPGDWTSVHVFTDPVSEDFVEREVGRPVHVVGGLHGGTILVFMHGDEVDRVVLMARPEISAGSESPGTTEHSAWVLLTARPGGLLARLVEPGLPS